MIDEIWVDVKGYEGLYRVSNHGRIMSCKRTRWNGIKMVKLEGGILSGSKRHDGYIIVSLYRNGSYVKEYVHRIVAEAFLPKTNESLIINHKDGNTSNNHIDNLEWCTYSYNHRHAYRVLKRKHSRPMTGRTGSLHPNSKSVQQFNSKGKLVGSYGSMREAERKTGIRNGGISSACISGKLFHEFYWKTN